MFNNPPSSHNTTPGNTISNTSALAGALRTPTTPITTPRFPGGATSLNQSQQRYVVYNPQSSQSRPASPQSTVFPPVTSSVQQQQSAIVRLVGQSTPQNKPQVIMMPVTSDQQRFSSSDLGVRSVFGGPPGMWRHDLGVRSVFGGPPGM